MFNLIRAIGGDCQSYSQKVNDKLFQTDHQVLLWQLPKLLQCQLQKIEPVHEISNNVVSATNKVSDQPAHTRSLIRAFVSLFGTLLLLSY